MRRRIQCDKCGGWYDLTNPLTNVKNGKCHHCQQYEKAKQKRKRSKNLETGVVRECLKWLRKHSQVIYVERRTTAYFSFESGGGISVGHPGAADIWCLVRESLSEMIVPADENESFKFRQSNSFLVKHIEIECKRRDGKGGLSENQIIFQAMCTANSIPYFVVTSAADLEKQLRADGFLS